MTEPRTEHGRYVWTTSKLHVWAAFDVTDILAIEAEVLRNVRAAVDDLPLFGPGADGVRKSAVLAILDSQP